MGAVRFVATEGSARSVDSAWIATDYCVRTTAADAAQPGFAVRVLIDLTAGGRSRHHGKSWAGDTCQRSQADRAGLAATSSSSLSVSTLSKSLRK
jgi:nicotinamidase-related amidase